MSDVVHERFLGAGIMAVVAVLVVIIFLRFGTHDRHARLGKGGEGIGQGQVAVPSKYFTIEGNLTRPISPGVMIPLDLEIKNPHSFPLSVTDLVVTVHDVSAPRAGDVLPCSVGDFAVDQASRLKITLAARSSGTLSSLDVAHDTWPRVGMLNRPVNQDGCKGASLTLAYVASGMLENE